MGQPQNVFYRKWTLSVTKVCKLLLYLNPQDTTHPYKDHVTNKEVHAKIQQAIRPHEDLLTIVKRLKLQWYGHVSRSSGLAKTILQGTVKGGRREGGQRKRWKRTGLEFGPRGQWRTGKNGENWLQKSSVVPQRP